MNTEASENWHADKDQDTTRLFLIRHGETPWNTERRFQGHTDIPLNENGVAQARLLAQRFHQVGRSIFDVCISSDLTRAVTTAELLNIHNLPHQQDPVFRERNFGHFAGMTAEEMEIHCEEEYQGIANRLPSASLTQGESLQQFYDRISSGLKKLLDEHKGKSVLLVAHGGVLDCIYRFTLQKPLEPHRDWLLPNCALNVIDFDPKGAPEILSWACTMHLDSNNPENIRDEVDGRVA